MPSMANALPYRHNMTMTGIKLMLVGLALFCVAILGIVLAGSGVIAGVMAAVMIGGGWLSGAVVFSVGAAL